MKRICVFTGTRADYGLLANVMKHIEASKKLELQIIASGSHVSNEFGNTYKFIQDDGFKIDELVDIELTGDITKSAGLGLIRYGEALNRLKPDVAIVLGDRYEALAFAFACNILSIPISHISGGDVTFGANDDAFRHAITKLSYLHFTTTENYKNRVIQLGEEPNRVFNVGSTGVENIHKIKLLDRQNLSKALNMNIPEEMLLCTFHPVTMEKGSSIKQIEELVAALNEIDIFTIITKANADFEGIEINKYLEWFAKSNKNIFLASSLGQLRYLSAMKLAKVVVGNSSSGIIEAPSLLTPTINIGKRQEGRIAAKSIINCEPIKNDILNAYKKISKITIDDFFNPYEKSDSSINIVKVLEDFNMENHIKYFHDARG